MRIRTIFCLVFFLIFTSGCGEGTTFEELIIKDVTAKVGTEVCTSIPSGAVIANVQILSIIPIKSIGKVNVTVSFDFEFHGEKEKRSIVLLYADDGGKKVLEEIGKCKRK